VGSIDNVLFNELHCFTVILPMLYYTWLLMAIKSMKFYNTTLQILGEGAGCDLINILENFFDIIQQLKLDFSSLHLYDSLCATTDVASIRSSKWADWVWVECGSGQSRLALSWRFRANWEGEQRLLLLYLLGVFQFSKNRSASRSFRSEIEMQASRMLALLKNALRLKHWLRKFR